MRPSVPSDGNQVIVDAKNKTTLKKLLTPSTIFRMLLNFFLFFILFMKNEKTQMRLENKVRKDKNYSKSKE